MTPKNDLPILFTESQLSQRVIVAATWSRSGCVIFLDTGNIINPFYEFQYRVRSGKCGVVTFLESLRRVLALCIANMSAIEGRKAYFSKKSD